MIIGLTGGIGSGKTSVSDIFESLGVCIVDADVASRVVVEKGKTALNKIEQHFGESILDTKGNLNRKKLREIIFTSQSEKIWLENLLHPLIGKEIQDQLKVSSSDYSILVSPLLLETNQKELCSYILVVDTSIDNQINRTVSRDKVPEEQVKNVISSQVDRKKRLQEADFIIMNDGSLEDLKNETQKLHEKFLVIVNEKG